MQISERRKLEIESLKKLIIETALDIAIQDNWEEVSMRKIAEVIDYSPRMLYNYFKNKEDILENVSKRGFFKLRLMVSKRLLNTRKPLAALVAAAETYWEFAADNPELYELMYLMATPIDKEEDERILEAVSEALLKIQPNLQASDYRRYYESFLAIVHGHISLVLQEKLHLSAETVYEQMRQQVKLFTQYLQSQSLLAA
ncbi:TetR/AcrR family transcriptional regulator [Eisenibacter elegans]|jgi:AcrR family transcriptional regulator|uniref:TetR/AcrR family transcriptional regulator n=1 Tax=Eisenibacter elegans TaxID=997 RepID=UPI000417A27E|nr:TetR/AcrR family transcriptional regulator [Eisenibacter elegans]